MIDTGDIAEFITGRLAERAADVHLIHALGCDALNPCADGCCTMGTCDCGEPERILVDIEAKRAILDRVVSAIRADERLVEGEWGSGIPDLAGHENSGLLLCLLATEFAGHPKFKSEWRIDA